MFSYNSNHKIITALLLLAWAVFHFATKTEKELSFSNGQLKNSGSVVNGKNHGQWVWYWENGNKKMEGQFNHGKRIGPWYTWDQNGKKVTEGHYQNDQLNGAFLLWNGDTITQQMVYKNDVLISKKTTTP